MANRFIAPILIALTIAVVVLATTSAYNSWVSSSLHSKQCARSDLILDTLHDVVQIAYTLPKGQKVSAAEADYIAAIEAQLFTRINQARC